MQRIEAETICSAEHGERWGHDPNLRAEIKRELAEAIGWKIRVADAIDFVLHPQPDGNVRIVASVMVSRAGDEH